jgi:hypothetical protein
LQPSLYAALQAKEFCRFTEPKLGALHSWDFRPAFALRATARQPSLYAALQAKAGGAEGIRTPDPHNAIVVLYQLSYDPIRNGGNLKGHTELSKQFFGTVQRKMFFVACGRGNKRFFGTRHSMIPLYSCANHQPCALVLF